ncbi:MAG: GGDEF domain-containing protein [Rhizobiales bacterium]|nr:GGDEF domain-containing protein [Rhizobacter sp.]
MNHLPRDENRPPEAQAQLGRIEAQVATMRAVLVQLLQDVVVAEKRLEGSEAKRLLEANEQLVVSALDAQTDADTANGALDEAARLGGLDPLTGLPNRTVLLHRFETAIFNAKRHGNRVALLFVDLDGFKQINDTFGHASGDTALQLVADCLSSLVRESDTVSRHGGDEFLVLLAEVTNAADAAHVAEKVNAALSAYSRVEGRRMQLRASIGISIYPEDGADAKTLIGCADEAMYVAKKQALGGVAFHRDPAPGGFTPQAVVAPPPQRPLTQYELAMAEQDQRQKNLRDANESLVLAALGAQDLLAAAEEMRRRQAELLAIVADELSNPYAPIRIAASTLGLPGAQAALLPRVQAVIELQAEKMASMVRQVLKQQSPDQNPGLDDT